MMCRVGRANRLAAAVAAALALFSFSCGVKAPPRPPAPDPVQVQPDDSHHDCARKGMPCSTEALPP
jgi:hypothetical protein